MSSTRGKTVPQEFYPTPDWCLKQLLAFLHLPGGLWLEPALGTGNVVRAVDDVRNDVHWTTADIVPEYLADHTLDYTDLDGPLVVEKFFDVAITNPPFSLALLFAQQMLIDADIAILLLRLDWLSPSTQQRSLTVRDPWLRNNKPYVLILPNRPSFTVGGGSDSNEYGWFCWGVGEPGTYDILPDRKELGL